MESSEQAPDILPVPPGPAPTKPRSNSKTAAVALLVLGTSYILMFVAGGELRQFAIAGLEALPFAVLAAVAYAAAGTTLFGKVLAFGYWTGLIAIVGLLAFVFVFVGLMERSPESYAPEARGLPPSDHLIRYCVALLGLGMAGVAGMACFLPVLRRQAAKILAVDPHSFVHSTALATVVAIGLMSLVPLLVLNEPPLLIVIQAENLGEGPTAAQQLRSTFYSLMWCVPVAFVAVGYPLKRNWRDASQRLALVKPTRRQLAAAVVLAAVLAAGVWAVSWIVVSIWESFGWKTTDETALLALFAFALTPLGAVIVSLAAGLGEELIFRGVLQPRLGILLPALTFAAIHAFQYHFDALIVVLLMGIVFGLIRRWSNTTTAAIVHMSYDFIVLMLTAAGY